jgi:protein TonB
MPGHVDVLEQRERLAGPFWGSLVLHAAVGGLLVGFAILNPMKRIQLGSPTGGGLGSVAVTPTPFIPLPKPAAPENPVANDTKSMVPAPPPKAKPQPKLKAPPPDAIPLKTRNATQRYNETPASPPNKFREQQQYKENQLYTSGGQALSSPMYRMPGGGGVGIGDSTPFGTQFGAYANVLRDQIARRWNTSDVDPRVRTAPAAAVRFSLRRDGTLVPGSVKVIQSSGNRTIDYSALRAVLDAVPFPPLPMQYQGNQADLELRFELRR